MQVKSVAHSAILSTFIMLPFVIKIFVLSIFEWPFHFTHNLGVFTYLFNDIFHIWKRYSPVAGADD